MAQTSEASGNNTGRYARSAAYLNGEIGNFAKSERDRWPGPRIASLRHARPRHQKGRMLPMDGWPVHSSFALAALTSAAFWARRHTEEVLRKWGLPAEMAETAVLVVSELVANAVKATVDGLTEGERLLYDHSPNALPYQRVAALGIVRLKVSCDYRRVLVEVWDCGPGVPVRTDPADDAVCGRGLLLVDSLCGRWGWYPVGNEDPGRPRGRGKVVWGLLCHSAPPGPHR
jgi:anti-sigma regulatory factor (Ser/Thr protein kinase)